MKANGYSSNVWRDMVRQALPGFVALAVMGLSPRVAEAGPCAEHVDCATDPAGPTCDNGPGGTKTCIKFSCTIHDQCNTKFPDQLAWCNKMLGFCERDIPNGGTFPLGVCVPNSNDAQAVCETDTCDAIDNVCGIQLGHKTCSQSIQCNAGKCQTETQSSEPTYGSCVDCLVANGNADCQGNAGGEVCDGSIHKCVQCTEQDTSKCPEGKKACDVTTATHTCVECVKDADCPSSKPDCDPVAKVCTKACTLDADCDTTTEWCKNPTGGDDTGTCTPKLPNEEKIPSVDKHMPPLDGTCSPEVGKSVCQSGACDVEADVCGINIHNGPCTTTSQCNEGLCVPGKSTCEPCLADADCKAPTPYCNTTTNQCGDCKTNADCKDPSKPQCDPGSYTCKPKCAKDSDCDAADWCNTNEGAANGVCTPDVPNGKPVPTSKNHEPVLDGKCTSEVGKAVCESGACSTKDDLCGLVGGEMCNNDNAVCRSNSCDDGVCTCEVDAHCGGPNSGMVCKLAAGPSIGACVPGCRGTGNKCPDDTCSSTTDEIAACEGSGEYLAGAGFCSGSPSRGTPGGSVAFFGILLTLGAAAGQLARRRRNPRKAS